MSLFSDVNEDTIKRKKYFASYFCIYYFFFYNLIIERDAYYAKFIGITFLHIFQYDTGSIPWVPHSALDLPGTENAPPRRSIE